MWETGGRFYARILDAPAFIEVTGVSKGQCLEQLRATVGEDIAITVEVIPSVVGVAEAAEIVGWDKRRVITYIDRGSFPEPITSLASGRIWLREDVEAYASEWHERRRLAGSAIKPTHPHQEERAP
jgi:predicted DNA-binding transcriptional regulator AlpA